MKYQVSIGEKKYEVDLDGDNSKATINGKKTSIDYRRIKGGKLHSILIDGIRYEFELNRENGGFNVWHRSGQTFAEVIDEKTERLRKLMGDTGSSSKLSVLKAPMPGLILKIEVEPGQEIKKGDGLVIVEAMKMENELKATAPGKVKEIKVKEKQPVEKNEVLIVFE